MSASSSGGRGAPPPATAASPGQKRPRGDDPASPSNRSESAPAKNPRRAFSSSPFADFGSYMAAKNSKLAAQFEADASTSAAEVTGGVFAGVSIFVDGFTVPSSQELKEIMLNNGGRFVNYFSRNTVTHIICTHLPNSKMSNLRAFSKGLPVVKPAWVVDSLAENRLLSCSVPYQISQHNSSSRKQTKLSSFFSGRHYQGELNDQSNSHELQSSSVQEGSQDHNSGCEKEGSLLKEEASKDSLSSDDHKASMFEEQDSEDFVDEAGNAYETACSERRDNDMDGKLHVAESPDIRSRCSNLCSTSSTGSHLSLDSLDRNATKSSSRTHSTLTDPNFVENYFKYSRLHFIGTWRNRYRKRFSNLLGDKSSKGNRDHSGKNNTIIHIDMAGMFVREAKARCPHLMIVPYDFDAYGEVADQFYGILHKYCSKVQALSCDEAFLDMTECLHDNPEEVTQKIRNEIFGISGNMLIARLATRSAKPNGQCFISSEKVDGYLNTLSIKALPGIGHTVSDKLKSKEVEYCGQLRNIPKESLHKDFGKKIGDMLWNYCRGIDHSVVEAVQETKSVGAEVNWGVRFNDNKDAENFLVNLSKEVCLRLEGCGVQGRTITLKLKTRRKGAGEPIKFMGCGDCETVSRSMTIAGATDNPVTLQRIAKQLFSSFCVDVKEVRGVGLKISRLEHADLARGAPQGNMLESWLASPSDKLKKHSTEKACLLKNRDDAATSERRGFGSIRPSGIGGTSRSSEVNPPSDRSTRVGVELPPLSELDLEVLKNLPPEIIYEMNDMYKGELHGFLGITSGDKAKESNTKSLVFPAVDQNLVPVLDTKLHGDGKHKDSIHFKKEADIKGPSGEQLSELKQANAPRSIASELVDIPTKSVIQHDFMPNSLSQADVTVLQELPEDVKADLFNALPLHRSGDPTCSTSHVSENKFPQDGRSDDPKQHPQICHLPGNSQKWIEEFRVSHCLILNVIAEQHTDSISSRPLSSVLEPVISYLPLCPNSGTEEWNEAFASLSELLTQYIHQKVESDIEELHKCFRLLKRLSSGSELFLELHDSILPLLQDSVRQHYGGILHLYFYGSTM
uniref:DNA repair protein REV1 n=2 Tax=Oryza rufipogon TaxID=4529 RepID=A0A0E0Q1X9_ORYRU